MSQSNKSPGPDGIPYKFYKFWIKYASDQEDVTDITEILENVYEDIDTHGIQA